MMKLILIIAVLFFGGSGESFAAPPLWQVNPAEYELSANVTIVVFVNGQMAAGEGNRVAAFVEGQVRGVAQAIEVQGDWLYFMTVYANNSGEQVGFKLYLNGRDEVVDLAEAIVFAAGQVYGDPLNPFAVFAEVEEERAPPQLITAVEERGGAPDLFALAANWPNPFNASTVIGYELPSDVLVEIAVYDLLGQRVRKLVSSRLAAGRHFAVWDGRDRDGRPVASGVYLYQMRVGDFVQVRKMALLK